MDSCGSQTLARSKGSIRSFFFDQLVHGTLLLWMVQGLILFVILSLLAGCVPSMKCGSPPKVKEVGTLKPGISGKTDVLTALGEPQGYGAARHSPGMRPREIWFYDYMETEKQRIGLKILLVFFDKEIYDGHLWFSSSQLLEFTD